MKNLLLIPLILLSFYSAGYAQLPNNNMYLLRNLNSYSGNLYSAIWGYTASNGREYALLSTYYGTSFVDITDSANIHEADFMPGPGSTIRESKVYSHYAYIITDVSDSSVGIQIVDLQYLPDSVRFVKNYNYSISRKIHTISQSGHYLYINGGNMNVNGGTTVIDISDPVNPVKRGSWTTKYVHDCRVIGDTIYACNIYSQDGGTITVINAADKNNLQTIGSWVNAPNPGPHNCDLTEDRKYCVVTDEINGSPRLLKIWDIQNLSNVTQVATWQPTGITTSIVHNVEVYGNYALVAHYTAGVRLVNITNPSLPVEAAWYDTYPADNAETFNGCWGVFLFPSGKIAASDRQTGLYVLKTLVPVSSTGNNGTVIPPDYALSQNYPNPFNPETKISFSLPKNAFVTLNVYDAAGRIAAKLVNDRRDAGTYEIIFDAKKYNLSSGVYFYNLASEDFSETKKMLLIK